MEFLSFYTPIQDGWQAHPGSRQHPPEKESPVYHQQQHHQQHQPAWARALTEERALGTSMWSAPAVGRPKDPRIRDLGVVEIRRLSLYHFYFVLGSTGM